MKTKFVDAAKNHLIKMFPECKFWGKFRGVDKSHILKKKQDVVKLLLDTRLRSIEECGKLFSGGVARFHQYAHHVNSSQIFCLNLFAPLLILEDSYRALSKLLKLMGVSFTGAITEAVFEYVPRKKGDRTNFDFYVKTEFKEEAFFEIKYTEQGFGAPSNGSFKEHEIAFYKNLCNDSCYLQCFSDDIEKKFLDANFQVWRNIGHVKDSQKQYSVFIFPERNQQLMRKFPFEAVDGMKRVLVVYSEQIITLAQKAFVGDCNLLEYYKKLHDVYFNF